MGWMRFLNSDDDVAVLNTIAPCEVGQTGGSPMLPFCIENKIMVNKGVKIDISFG
jgi:hypothetical protein